MSCSCCCAPLGQILNGFASVFFFFLYQINTSLWLNVEIQGGDVREAFSTTSAGHMGGLNVM